MTGGDSRCLWFDTAWGRGCLTYASDPFYILGITLPGKKSAAGLNATSELKMAHPRAIQAGRTIAAYFKGRRPSPIPDNWLALDRLTPKEQAVLRTVRGIPYGATRTYAEVARMAGFPRGARFAGNTLHKNPFPVIVPCHRVVRSDGTIGGFAAGCSMKERMIALEKAAVNNRF